MVITSSTFLLNKSLTPSSFTNVLMASHWTGQWDLVFPQVFRTLFGQGCGECSAIVCHLVAEVEHNAWSFSQLYSLGCVGFSSLLSGWCFRPLELSSRAASKPLLSSEWYRHHLPPLGAWCPHTVPRRCPSQFPPWRPLLNTSSPIPQVTTHRQMSRDLSSNPLC